MAFLVENEMLMNTIFKFLTLVLHFDLILLMMKWITLLCYFEKFVKSTFLSVGGPRGAEHLKKETESAIKVYRTRQITFRSRGVAIKI